MTMQQCSGLNSFLNQQMAAQQGQLAQLLGNYPTGASGLSGLHAYSVRHKEKTFVEELQAETDEWLKNE